MVNTFIPYSDFKKCAKVLDNKRLGKQRVEAMQIINILEGKSKGIGWKNHVVTRLWTGYIDALKLYHNTIVEEWIRRGFNNTMKLYKLPKNIEMPWFIYNKSIQYSHRANLIRKLKSHYYPKFGKSVPVHWIKHKYIWPNKLTKELLDKLKANPNKLVDIIHYAEKQEE